MVDPAVRRMADASCATLQVAGGKLASILDYNTSTTGLITLWMSFLTQGNFRPIPACGLSQVSERHTAPPVGLTPIGEASVCFGWFVPDIRALLACDGWLVSGDGGGPTGDGWFVSGWGHTQAQVAARPLA